MAGELSPDTLAWLREQRWFGARERTIDGAHVADSAELGGGARLELVEVRFADGGSERYALVRTDAEPDAIAEPRVGEAQLQYFRGRETFATRAGGALRFAASVVLSEVSDAETVPIRPLGVEQSNTSLRFGTSLILKLIRRPQSGPHPEAEITGFLTERTEFRNMPLLAGTATYLDPSGETSLLMVLQTLVPNVGDAWATTLQRLEGVCRGENLDDAVHPLRRLGEVTADLHLALASHADDPNFAPQPITVEDVATWSNATASEVDEACLALRRHGLTCADEALHTRHAGLGALVGSLKTRHHGDYHLGQVLEQPDGDFAIIDFEGEPRRPLAVRREKRSPLRDVAGMLRSLDYARYAARTSDTPPVEIQRLDTWYAAARAAYLGAYQERIQDNRPDLVPAGQAFHLALSALELEKAAYEVLYEVSHRPAFLHIPARALAATL